MADLVAFYGSHGFWAWTALAAALLAVEVVSGSGWLLWPATMAGVVAVLTALTPLTPASELAVFALLTIVTTFLARRYLPHPLRARGKDINDNIGRLVGHEGRAVGAFESRLGRVFIDGKEWAAELAEGDQLAPGTRVQVVGVHGARLTVRQA